MDELQSNKLLGNHRGQGVMEYILLLAVITTVAMSVFKSRAFKNFIGDKGFVSKMRDGMRYSYRYGRDSSTVQDVDKALEFNYQNNQHDTYLMNGNTSRFFSGLSKYPEN